MAVLMETEDISLEMESRDMALLMERGDMSILMERWGHFYTDKWGDMAIEIERVDWQY